MIRATFRRDRWATAVLLGTAVLLWAAAAGAAGWDRGARREALKAEAAAAGAQQRRLLVIPVDFADARLPADWTPLAAAAGLDSLRAFWARASDGILDLETVLAPPVHLPGTRRDYSDRDLGGDLIRSRALAADALTATAAALPLALADADSDGEVDGVLLLHAAPGLENDPVTGLIQPLQSYLLEPVVHRGTLARLYAVASLQARTGLWIHETGHLLGLEDRYDLALSGGQVDGENVAGGGLGVFSLMAAGWTGAPSELHLDAYSRAALGWTTPQPAVDGAVTWSGTGGASLRLDLDPDGDAASYYLLETVSAPRLGLPPGESAVLAYHVDEGVPEDGQSSSDPNDRHLRVRLVEADGDGALARGEDAGGWTDAWRSGAAAASWPEPTPPYGGSARTAVDAVREGAAVDLRALTSRWKIRAEFTVIDEDTILVVQVDPWGPTPPSQVALAVLDGTGDPAVITAPLQGGDPYVTAPIVWTPAPDLVPGDVTRLRLTVTPGPTVLETAWAWGGTDPTLLGWPAGWTLTDAAWRDGAAAGMAPGEWTVVAALGPAADPADWPDVRIANALATEILSPPLPAGTPVLLRHWPDLGPGDDGFHGDGAVLEYVLADGTRAPATPRGGYPGAVDRASTTALAGRAAFADAGPLDEAGAPLWRLDWIPAPDAAAPYRLAFRAATDGLWSGRGWWLGGLRAAVPEDTALVAPTLADGAWTWSADGASEVQISADGADWITVAVAADPWYPEADLLADLAALGCSRARLRIVVQEEGWRRATAPASLAGARAADPFRDLAAWPNPSRDGCRIHLSVAEGVQDAALDLHDLRGRRLRSWTLAPGDQIVAWDGRDAEGRRLPAGRYLLRARLDGAVLRRSVTLLP